MFGCLASSVVIVVVVGYIVGREISRSSEASRKELHDANVNYRNALKVLKQYPNDPDLRERALEWGRHYSNLTRQRTGVTIYDEVALANDIDAACAARGGSNSATVVQTQTIEDRLRNLRSLFDQGLISESEYQDRRAKLIDEV